MTTTGRDTAAQRLVCDLIEGSPEGIAAIDAHRNCVYANTTARRLLSATSGCDVAALVDGESTHTTRWPFVSAGQDLTAILFSEPERTQRQLQRVAAFARTAARVACREPLQDVLNRVAQEARNATGAKACSIILLEPDAFRVRLIGTAGHTADYVDRLMQCVELGAPLASIDAFWTGRPARLDRLGALAAGDTRYEPFATLIADGGWDSVIAVPTVIQGRCVGMLTCFFGADEQPADDNDVMFLLALADQTATAVDNANLVAELQSTAAAAERYNLAIDLHDSVSQALFSVIMQTRALSLRTGGDDPIDRPALHDAIVRLEATAEEMQRQIRGLLYHMQSESPWRGLREDLDTLLAQLSEMTSDGTPKLHLELPDTPLPSIDEGTRNELIRVIREAVTNSIRHASATSIMISLTVHEDQLVAVIEDNGIGFSPVSSPPGHLGLESMTRRTARLGGRLVIDASSAGTVVCAALPLTPHYDPEGTSCPPKTR